MEKLVDYESYVIEKFREDPELGLEMVKDAITEYYEDDEVEDVTYVLLILRRIIKAGGFAGIDELKLSENQMEKAVESVGTFNREIVNKMLEALKIDERI